MQIPAATADTCICAVGAAAGSLCSWHATKGLRVHLHANATHGLLCGQGRRLLRAVCAIGMACCLQLRERLLRKLLAAADRCAAPVIRDSVPCQITACLVCTAWRFHAALLPPLRRLLRLRWAMEAPDPRLRVAH